MSPEIGTRIDSCGRFLAVPNRARRKELRRMESWGAVAWWTSSG